MASETREFTVVREGGEMNKVAFEITQNKNGTWYAYAKGFGCSRDHAYWYHAVRELMDAQGISQYF